jgi:hypothetical protein
VAGADKVLGTSLHTERVVGMGLRLLLIWAVFLMALEWGLLTAAVAATIAAMALVPVVAANAIVGVEAFGLLGLALLVRAMVGACGRRRDRLGGRSTSRCSRNPDEFCLRLSGGTYGLYERCRPRRIS